jgi:hypothetical protein
VVSFTPRPLYPRERAPGTHCIGGWVDPRAGLDSMEKWSKNECVFKYRLSAILNLEFSTKEEKERRNYSRHSQLKGREGSKIRKMRQEREISRLLEGNITSSSHGNDIVTRLRIILYGRPQVLGFPQERILTMAKYNSDETVHFMQIAPRDASAAYKQFLNFIPTSCNEKSYISQNTRVFRLEY